VVKRVSNSIEIFQTHVVFSTYLELSVFYEIKDPILKKESKIVWPNLLERRF
jgi:hypothetical protein